MAIALDLDSNANSGSTTVSSLIWSHTCSGANRILLVGIAYTGSSATISSVTYNGVAMTALFGTPIAATSALHVQIFYLLAPATGANNIVVTPSITASIYGGAASFTGVDQSAPSNTNSGIGTTLSPSVSLTTVNDNAWIFDTIGMASAVTTLTAGGSQIQDFNQFDATPNRTGAGSHLATTTHGAYSMAWTESGSIARAWGQGVVELKPAAAGALGPDTDPAMYIRNAGWPANNNRKPLIEMY
jgi:hypothetical protein